MDWVSTLYFVTIMALLLLLSYIDQHYSGIVARKDREIRSMHDELVSLRALADAMEAEFEREMEEAREDHASPYTIQYPLDDRPWPKKDGLE